MNKWAEQPYSPAVLEAEKIFDVSLMTYIEIAFGNLDIRMNLQMVLVEWQGYNTNEKAEIGNNH